ncbi:DUF4835 family protein [Bacteroidales bacterium OttesenSCG-928-B11]|nr:DUF4835 family protein [Bacteroidales bacterium OttesenSCG-928-B11]
MKKIIILTFLFLLTLSVSAQDFRCQVSINTSQISGSNRNRYDALREALTTFINDQKWCSYNLRNNERIECALLLNLSDASGDVMTGTMTIQLQRPVYNASYKSTVLNFVDKNIKFTYEEGAPLEYSESTNLGQLTSLVAFYLNLFLAVDFDTFSNNGGAEYYSKCNNIISLNQNSSEPGWKSFEGNHNNRYWLIENFTNGQYSKIHDFLYTYHRLGLDVMAESPDAGRSVIAESLRTLQQVNAQRSGLYMIQVIVQSKADEIINIFKQGLPGEKTQVVNILKQLDPANSSKYDAINASK